MANIKWAENMADNDFIQNIIFIKNMTNIRWMHILIKWKTKVQRKEKLIINTFADNAN